MTITARETTTLPEGAQVTVEKCQTVRQAGGLTTFTQLRAFHGENEIKMRVDDVSAANLRQYLDLLCREINRRRDAIKERPAMLKRHPENIAEFVNNMAFNGMFILTAWNDTSTDQRLSTVRGQVESDT